MSYKHLILATVLLVSPTLAVASTASLSGTKHTWSNESGAYKGLVKSTQPISVMDADADPRLIWSVGTQAKLECTIYSEAVEPAQFLLDWTADILSRKSTVTARTTSGVSAGQVQGVPYLSLTTSYTAGKPQTMKSYIIDIPFGAIACSHDEPGHESLVLSHLDYLMKHIEIPYNFDLRKTHRIFLVWVNAQPVGFEQQTVRRAPEGKLIDKRRASLLIPHGPGAFIPVDKATIETLAFNGTLLRQQMVMRGAGRTERFDVQSKDYELYTGSGEVNGKSLDIRFKVPSHSLMGVRTASSGLAQKLAQQRERRPITLPIYNPSIHQQGPTNHVSELISKLPNGGYKLQEAYGPQSRKTTRNAKGHLLTATSPLGPSTMETTRIFAKDYPRPRK